MDQIKKTKENKPVKQNKNHQMKIFSEVSIVSCIKATDKKKCCEKHMYYYGGYPRTN